MAHIVAVANTDAGVGKSTISGNLAWAFATSPLLRRRVLVVDADPKASLTKWFDRCGKVPFHRTQLNTTQLIQTQLPGIERRYDLIVIDCPPVQLEITAAAISVAMHVVVPIETAPLKGSTYAELIPLLSRSRSVHARLQFVLNQVAPRINSSRDVEELLSHSGMRLFEAKVQHRQDYRRALANGQSVFDQPGPASEEILALATELASILGGSGGTGGSGGETWNSIVEPLQ